jgi:hypothetical protein
MPVFLQKNMYLLYSDVVLKGKVKKTVLRCSLGIGEEDSLDTA